MEDWRLDVRVIPLRDNIFILFNRLMWGPPGGFDGEVYAKEVGRCWYEAFR